MRRPLLLRLLCAVVTAAVVVPLAPSSPAAAAARTVNRSTLAAYLIDQLYDADAYQPFGPGFADTGLSIDGALALSAAGGHDATVARIRGFVADQIRSFADPTDADGAFSGGGVGKLALLAEVTGADPRSFGGFDLIGALADNVCPAAHSTACPGAGLYRGVTSTFGQALGLLAQARSGAAPAAAVTALVAARCRDGSFRSILPVTGACSAGAGDVDSTSMAAQALSAVRGQQRVVDAAVAWIGARQEKDGGFPGTAGDNTNSAALAVQALSLHASTYAARIAKAQAFLGGRQNRDGGLGINTTSDGAASDVRASAQGLNGVLSTPFSTLTRVVSVGGVSGGGVSGGARSTATTRGAAYLASPAVLTGGTHVQSGGYVDYGLTADIAIALAAAGASGTGQTTVRLKAVVTYLRAHVAAYADPDGTTPGLPGPYSGALAKLALLAEITGQNPRSFGGYDLLGLLREHQCAKANAAGTCTAAGDFFQAFSGVSQALGVLALARAGSVKASDPGVVRLRQMQCPDGGFSSTLPPASPCVSDIDTTGFALQALALVTDDSSAPTSAAADAMLRGQDYVLAARRRDGSYPGAAGNNTNSTALAVQALLAAPGTRRVSAGAPAVGSAAARPASSAAAAAGASSPSGPAIAGALAFLIGEQNGDGGFGINAAATASDARASAQVVPALALASLNTLRQPVTLGAYVAPSPTSTPPARTSAVAHSSVRATTAPATRLPATRLSATMPSGATKSATTLSATSAGSVPAAVIAGPTALANTGVPRRALDDELLAVLVLLVGGSALIAAGGRRPPRGRHQ